MLLELGMLRSVRRLGWLRNGGPDPPAATCYFVATQIDHGNIFAGKATTLQHLLTLPGGTLGFGCIGIVGSQLLHRVPLVPKPLVLLGVAPERSQCVVGCTSP